METNKNELLVQQIDYSSAKVVQTLKSTVAQGLTNEEFALFVEHCRSTGLNPFKKEVWAIKAGGRLQLMTGINGYFTIANRHTEFDGYEEGFVSIKGEELSDTYAGNDFVGAWCKVYRKDRKVPAKGVAFLAEYDKGHGNWKTMRRVMILKCAESVALRKAFPQELAGTYTPEEMPLEYSEIQQAPVQKLVTADDLPKVNDEVVNFGKHKGKKWSDVDTDYLEWLWAQNGKSSPRAKQELDRRQAQKAPDHDAIMAEYEESLSAEEINL